MNLPKKPAFSTTGNVYDDPEQVYASVQTYYGRVLNSTSDLKTSACLTSGRPPSLIRSILAKVPGEILEKYYGCGTPLPFGIEGLDVLDLGSGSGRDCYVAAALVGPQGTVTGLDMTLQQLQVARRYVDEYTQSILAYPQPNLQFKQGYIEFLDKAGIAPNSMDLVISNCVINLSPNKQRVLEQVYSVLRNGGELYFSDVYCDRRLPEDVRTHDVLLGECLGGALYIEDFMRLCHRIGFTDPRQLSLSPIEVRDEELVELLGEAKFYSITYRCFKLPQSLETKCEDYGQIATYRGKIPGHTHAYRLDDHHVFETHRPLRVCGNTAAMVQESWLSKYFDVLGDRNTHYGLFDCSNASNSSGKATGAPSACSASTTSTSPSCCE